MSSLDVSRQHLKNWNIPNTSPVTNRNWNILILPNDVVPKDLIHPSQHPYLDDLVLKDKLVKSYVNLLLLSIKLKLVILLCTPKSYVLTERNHWFLRAHPENEIILNLPSNEKSLI